MATSRTRRITTEIDATLYGQLIAVAKRKGQTRRRLIEQALASCLHNVMPSRHVIGTDAMEAFEQSVIRNRDLLQRLAK